MDETVDQGRHGSGGLQEDFPSSELSEAESERVRRRSLWVRPMGYEALRRSSLELSIKSRGQLMPVQGEVHESDGWERERVSWIL